MKSKEDQDEWVKINVNAGGGDADADSQPESSSQPQPPPPTTETKLKSDELKPLLSPPAPPSTPPSPQKDAFPLGFHRRLWMRQECHLHLAQLYKFIDSIFQSILIVCAALVSSSCFVDGVGTGNGNGNTDANENYGELVENMSEPMPMPPSLSLPLSSSFIYTQTYTYTYTYAYAFQHVIMAVIPLIQSISTLLQLRKRAICHKMAYRQCTKLRVQLEHHFMDDASCVSASVSASANVSANVTTKTADGNDIDSDSNHKKHHDHDHEKMMQWLEKYRDYVQDAPPIPPSILAAKRRRQ